MQLETRLSSVVAVLTDIEARSLLSDTVSEATILRRESDTRFQVYSVMNAPWPFANRDMLNQCEIAQDPQSLAVTIHSVAIEGDAPVKDGYVRIVNSRQEWRLTPYSEGSVRVEMRAFTDPGGSVPPSILNRLSVETPFKTLGSLRELVQGLAYRDASLAFIKEP